MFIASRSQKNPILEPAPERPWEAVAAFNPSPVIKDGIAHVFYRALARPDVLLTPYAGRSTISYATSTSEGTFGNHRQVIAPSEAWEHFGCEDPRATFFEGSWYVFYTALGGYPFSAANIRVALAKGDQPDRLTEKHLITPFNAKAAALFPERVGGKVALLLTAHTDEPPSTIAIALADSVEDFWSPAFWDAWHADLASHKVDIKLRSDRDHLEVGAVPLLTEQGWLLAYSYIQNYFGGGQRVFGIEALLLDRDDPRKILGTTKFPILTPETAYERYGMVADIVFPTGLVRRDDILDIYYGAADTASAIVHVSLPDLLSAMTPESRDTFMTRHPGNPILKPVPLHPWESKSVSNAAALDVQGSVHLLYRAQGEDNTSVLGYARLEDGVTVEERLPGAIYLPRQAFEGKRGKPDGNSGCEDPRMVCIDDQVHICYTAYDGVHETRGALASIPLADFLAHRFEKWTMPTLLTPSGINDKDVSLFPERIHGEVCVVHRIDPNICLDMSEHLPPEHEVNRCIELMGPRPGMWDAEKVGIAGPPHRLPQGWLFLYHAVGNDHVYRLGAALLNNDATAVLGRTNAPILEPVMDWEKNGVVNNVVFSCGSVLRGDTLFIYYGGADTALGVATISKDELVRRLEPALLTRELPPVLVFDLDKTLARSKEKITPDMAELLTELLARANVAVISGGAREQLTKQVADMLPKHAKREHLFILSTSGAALAAWREGVWHNIYQELLTKEEADHIKQATEKGITETGVIDMAAESHGERIEYRDAQVTLSALGQEAPIEEKEVWDPKQEKKKALQIAIAALLPDYDVKIGGATSIDITKRGVNKAFGIRKLSEYLKTPISSMLYVGDALYPGGNDEIVKETGIPTRSTSGPDETASIIRELLGVGIPVSPLLYDEAVKETGIPEVRG